MTEKRAEPPPADAVKPKVQPVVAPTSGGSAAKELQEQAARDASERVTPLELTMLTTLAEHRRPVAMNKLGVAYREGIGVRSDYAKARNLFADAAQLGYAPAMQNLAGLYRDGKGVEHNDTEALACTRRPPPGAIFRR